MRVPLALPVSLLLAALLPLGLRAAEADSWLPPRPKVANAADGRWYVIVQPRKGYSESDFLLVERGKGKPPRAQPPQVRGLEPVEPLKLEKGDRLVAKGQCKTPLRVKCLSAGRGFVLFDTYGRVGYGTTLERFDGKGQRLWTRKLLELVSPADYEGFRRSVSSIWWSEAMWVDEAAQDIVVIYRSEKGPPKVVRVALADGRTKGGTLDVLLGRIGGGSAHEQVTALEIARKIDLKGLLPAVQAALADASTPALARAHYAVHLHGTGDERGKAFLMAAAQAGQSSDVRGYAIKHLPKLHGLAALPALQEAMRSKDDLVWRSAEEGLRGMGRDAVPTLIEMVSDETATGRYRQGAATALWNMPVEDTLAAEAALEKASKSKHERLAYAAGHALEQIRAFKKR